MATKTGICNLALSRVGVKQFISSIDDDSVQAQALNVLYDHVRDLVLTDFEWGFAEARAELALISNAYSEWGYAFELPTDCLKPRYLNTGIRNLPVEARDSFRVSGRTLFTDQAVAELTYTQRVDSEALFSSYFAEALAWRLAGELTSVLSVKPPTDMMRMYQMALANASVYEIQGQQKDLLPDAEHIRARN